MFRYVAYILVTVIAVVLAGAVAVVLGKGVVDCLSGRPVVYVTALDGVGSVGGHPPRIRAMFEGPAGPRPLEAFWAVVRFPGGWSRWAYVNRRGLCRPNGPGGLPPGPHRFEVGLPESYPRLDVVAHGTAWIWPADTVVVWIDSGAVVPGDAAGTGRTEAVDVVIDALKTLAGTCRPVYLVADDARPYAAIRRRLKEWGAPAGPVFWVIPDRTGGRLQGLQGVWPVVRGAVIASDDLAEAARRLDVPVERVPPPDGAGSTQSHAQAWRRTLDRLTSLPSTNPSHGR